MNGNVVTCCFFIQMEELINEWECGYLLDLDKNMLKSYLAYALDANLDINLPEQGGSWDNKLQSKVLKQVRQKRTDRSVSVEEWALCVASAFKDTPQSQRPWSGEEEKSKQKSKEQVKILALQVEHVPAPVKEDTAGLLAVFKNPHTSMKKVRRAWPRRVHKVCNADKNVYPPKYGDDDETFGAMKYFMLLCRGREKNKLVQVSALTDMDDDDDEEKNIMLTFVNALNDSAWDPVESKLEPQMESVPHASILRYLAGKMFKDDDVKPWVDEEEEEDVIELDEETIKKIQKNAFVKFKNVDEEYKDVTNYIKFFPKATKEDLEKNMKDLDEGEKELMDAMVNLGTAFLSLARARRNAAHLHLLFY
jgi:hypothetical protein